MPPASTCRLAGRGREPPCFSATSWIEATFVDSAGRHCDAAVILLTEQLQRL
uniref:Uncharacterized protein n=1 Tax=Triticum urartu TaxID=4572 RepID=A0A8R7P2J9_TRIUA